MKLPILAFQLALFCWAIVGVTVLGDPPDRKPNIILIMADDLGYGDLGSYGRKDIATPHLDALAREGLRFTDYHSNGAVCSPTRAAMMTGRYQQRCGIEGVVTAAGHRDTGLPLEEITIAEMLKSSGYRTALFGKWHLGYEPRYGPNQQGFDEFRGFVSGNVDYHSHIDQVGRQDWWRNDKLEVDEGYLTDLITIYAVDFIQRNQDVPFFLFLSHGAPHYPIQGPDDAAIRSTNNAPKQQGSRKQFLEGYRQMIKSLDDSIARTREAVQEAGVERRTLILFVSDNGAAQTYGGSVGALRGWKSSLYEGGHRVPAIAYMPGSIKPGETSETAISFDWFATCAAMTRTDVSAEFPLDGVDLSPLLFEGKPLTTRDLFWSTNPGSTAMRSGKWKLIAAQGRLELFDLQVDVEEAKNVAHEHPHLVNQMKLKLDAWEKDVRQNVKRRS